MPNTLPAPTFVALSHEDSKAFDGYVAARKRQSKAEATARAAKREADTHKEHLKTVLEAGELGQLPDGRTIVRVDKAGHRGPMKACDWVSTDFVESA